MSPYSFICKFVEFPSTLWGRDVSLQRGFSVGYVFQEARTSTCGQCFSKTDAKSCRGAEVEGLALRGSQVMFITMVTGDIGVGSVKVRKDDPSGSLWLWPVRVSEIAKEAHRYCVLRITFSMKSYKEMNTSLFYCLEWFHADFFYRPASCELLPCPRSFLPWFLHFIPSLFTYFFIHAFIYPTGIFTVVIEIMRKHQPLKI